MKLSILIPVYNEANTIERLITAVDRVELACSKEIIVIDDGSTDGTKAQISKLKLQSQNLKLKTIYHSKNQGKGAAVRTGIKHATGDYILIQDADLEYDPNDIPKLLAPLLHHILDPIIQTVPLD